MIFASGWFWLWLCGTAITFAIGLFTIVEGSTGKLGARITLTSWAWPVWLVVLVMRSSRWLLKEAGWWPYVGKLKRAMAGLVLQITDVLSRRDRL